MARDYENFDIVFEADGPTYTVRFSSLDGAPSRALGFPLEEHELDAFLGMFGKHQRRRMESPELTRATMVGRRLFDAVFDDDIRAQFLQSVSDAKRSRKGLRVRLDLSHADDLITLPWEYLYRVEGDDFVALSNYTPVVRYLQVGEPLPPAPLEGPLKVLVMISDPIERRGTLDVEREWTQLRDSLADEVTAGEVVLTRLPDGRLESLQTELQVNDHHVFHFIGHGEFSEVHDDGVLVMEDARARETHVPGRLLGDYLRDCLSMRLVVLNNCEGAATSESDPFAGSAQSLLRKGMPAVVAMQFEITDQAAIDFARGFYVGLMNGFPVEGALAEARKTMRRGPTIIEFGSPVLYMSSSDGAVFEKTEPRDLPSEESARHDDVVEALADVDTLTDLDSEEGVRAAPERREDELAAPGRTEEAPAPPESTEAMTEVRPPVVEPTIELPPTDAAPTDAPPTPPRIKPETQAWWRSPWVMGVGAVVAIGIIFGIIGAIANRDDSATDTTIAFQDEPDQPTTTIGNGQVLPGADPVLQAGPNGFASRIDAALTIDGSDDEWTTPFVFESNELVFDSTSDFSGTDDASSTWRVGWDDEFLYVFVTVVDDVASQTRTGAEVFRGDAIGIYFDPFVGNNAPGLQLNPGEHTGTFLGRNGESVVLVPNPAGSGFVSDGALVNDPRVQHQVVETGSGYTLEAAIPWDVLNVSPDQVEPGSVFRMTRDVSDSDVTIGASQQETMISNSPNRTADGQALPENWADLTLLGAGETSIPQTFTDDGTAGDGSGDELPEVNLPVVPAGFQLVEIPGYAFVVPDTFLAAELSPGQVAANYDDINFELAEFIRGFASAQEVLYWAYDLPDIGVDAAATNILVTRSFASGATPESVLEEAFANFDFLGGAALSWDIVPRDGFDVVWIDAELPFNTGFEIITLSQIQVVVVNGDELLIASLSSDTPQFYADAAAQLIDSMTVVR